MYSAGSLRVRLEAEHTAIDFTRLSSSNLHGSIDLVGGERLMTVTIISFLCYLSCIHLFYMGVQCFFLIAENAVSDTMIVL